MFRFLDIAAALADPQARVSWAQCSVRLQFVSPAQAAQFDTFSPGEILRPSGQHPSKIGFPCLSTVGGTLGGGKSLIIGVRV